MSQVLQWMQLEALMMSCMSPASFGWYSYTPAGQNLTQHNTEINYYSGEESPPTASPALRPGELGPVDILRDLVIEQCEVRRLVGFVVCS